MTELGRHQGGIFPSLAASIFAMSILRMVIMASIPRFTAAGSGSFIVAIGRYPREAPAHPLFVGPAIGNS
jgi:hypothetical protein